ncbi:MAG: ABC transporter permease [Anaerolineae bacterium]|nr:MAG: ABC transporter permease [Anaerolineae bacterium]
MISNSSEAKDQPGAFAPPKARVSFLKRRQALGWLRQISIRLTVPLVLIVIWVIVSEMELIRPLFLPPPGQMKQAFENLDSLLPQAILTTTTMTLTGFAIGTAVGTLMGLIMAYSRIIREFLGTVFDFLRPVPVFALIPLFILWFGIGRAPQVALIAMGTSVILGVTTLEAIRNVPPIYIRAALTLGANRRRIYRTIILPYIIPHLIGAIRVSAAASWGLDVAAEFMGSQQGLGYLIILQQTYLRTSGIILLVIVYSILAFITDMVIAFIEAHITRWTERRTSGGIVASIIGLA